MFVPTFRKPTFQPTVELPSNPRMKCTQENINTQVFPNLKMNNSANAIQFILGPLIKDTSIHNDTGMGSHDMSYGA